MAAWNPVAAVVVVVLAAGCLAIGEPAALACPGGRVAEVHGGDFAETYAHVVVLEGEAESLVVEAELAHGAQALLNVRSPNGTKLLEARLDNSQGTAEQTIDAPSPGKWTAVVERAAGATVELRWSC